MQTRPRLFPPALVGLVGLCLLVSACGGSSSSHVAQLGSATTATTTQSSAASMSAAQSAYADAALAFSRCMRSHGVSNFPDPDALGNFQPFNTGVSKQTSTAANDACEHLLPSGVGGGGAGTRGDQQKLAFGLRSARCMRSHGYPTYPDPPNANASSQGSGTRFRGTGIDTKSPQFQTTEKACEKQTRKALGLP